MQQFIEGQIELGEEGLGEIDYYLLEVNLEDLETTSGEITGYSRFRQPEMIVNCNGT